MFARSIRKDQGLKAASWLVDRDAGKGLIATFWESAGARVTTDRFEIIDSLP